MIFGHVAVSALAYRYLKADFVPVMAAAVVPDIVDKIAHYTLHQGAGSRWMGHTLIGVAVSTAVIALVWGKRPAQSWALGYLLHLVGEFGGVVPYLFPLIQYEFPYDYSFTETLGLSLMNLPRMALEVSLCLWAGVALFDLWILKEKRHNSILFGRGK
ncbi:MAG TPA: hypothetical protein PLJ78_08465 [Anaerolineae bacterium]|nr:hypothetical protein [Anaerolineae bacterium]HQK13959.1 hypothetical protein [Anaerolineae bacterium]